MERNVVPSETVMDSADNLNAVFFTAGAMVLTGCLQSVGLDDAAGLVEFVSCLCVPLFQIARNTDGPLFLKALNTPLSAAASPSPFAELNTGVTDALRFVLQRSQHSTLLRRHLFQRGEQAFVERLMNLRHQDFMRLERFNQPLYAADTNPRGWKLIAAALRASVPRSYCQRIDLTFLGH